MTPGLLWRVLHVVADGVVSMDVRLAIAALVQAESAGLRVSVSAFCAEHGLTRKTYYDLRRRYRKEGLEGLVPRSRRPLSSPNQTPAAMVDLVVGRRLALVAEGLDAGAQSIRWWLGQELEQEGGDPSDLPSVRTIHRILVANALVVPQPHKRPRSSYKRFASPWANGCWQLDGHKVALADHAPAVVLRVQDDHSRRIMATRAAATENTTDAWACVHTAITRHGAPAMFLSDNGPAFSQRRAKGVMSEFEARLRGEGILPVTASVGRPQTCGKKEEREWQTLDRWLAARPPAADLAKLRTSARRLRPHLQPPPPTPGPQRTDPRPSLRPRHQDRPGTRPPRRPRRTTNRPGLAKRRRQPGPLPNHQHRPGMGPPAPSTSYAKTPPARSSTTANSSRSSTSTPTANTKHAHTASVTDVLSHVSPMS